VRVLKLGRLLHVGGVAGVGTPSKHEKSLRGGAAVFEVRDVGKCKRNWGGWLVTIGDLEKPRKEEKRRRKKKP